MGLWNSIRAMVGMENGEEEMDQAYGPGEIPAPTQEESASIPDWVHEHFNRAELTRQESGTVKLQSADESNDRATDREPELTKQIDSARGIIDTSHLPNTPDSTRQAGPQSEQTFAMAELSTEQMANALAELARNQERSLTVVNVREPGRCR
jgi:hypothetical protein